MSKKNLILFFLFFSVMYANAVTINLTQKEKEFIKNNPLIVLGNTPDFEPAVIKKTDGTFEGYEIDIANLVRKRTGLNITFELGKWNEIVQKAKDKKLDGLSSTAVRKDRAKYFNFSKVYGKTSNVVAVQTGNPHNIQSLKDLKNKTIPVAKGLSIVESFAKAVGAKILYVDKIADAGKAVTNGKADFFIAPENIMLLAEKGGFSGFIEVVFPLPNPTELVYSIDKDKPELLSILNKVIDSMSFQDIRKIREKWHNYGFQKNKTIMLTNEEQSWIKSNPVASIVLPKNFPPFTYSHGKKYIGFHQDLLKSITNKTGLKFKPTYSDDWSLTLNKLKSNKIDMISNISYKKERESFTLFTRPYYEIPIAIYVRNDFKNYTNLNSLKGKKVAILKDIFFKDELKKSVGNNLIEYSNNKEMLDSLVYGKSDVLIANMTSINSLVKKYLYTNIQLIGELNLEINTKEDLRFGVAKNKPILHSIVSKALNSLSIKEVNNIQKKWFDFINNSRQSNVVLTYEESEWLKNNPIITVGGSSKEIEPDFVKMPDGTIEGFLVDAYKLLEKRLNIKFKYVDDKFSNVIKKTINSEIDLVGAWGEPFTKKANLIPVKLPFGVFIAIFKDKRNTSPVNSIEDLYGKKVAYWDGIVELDSFLKQHPKIERVVVETPLNGFQSVLTNKVDFFIGFNQDAYVLTKHNIVEIEPVFAINEVKIVSVAAVRSNAPELASILKKALSTITQEEIRDINKKWSWVPEEKQITKVINFNKDEKQYLLQKKSIKMCVDPHWMPYEWINQDGKHEGMAADVMSLIKKRGNIKTELIHTKDWQESLESAKSRKCDILPLAMETPDRKKYMDFTKTYFSFPFVIATKTDELFITNPEDVLDKPLGVHKGYAAIEILKKHYPSINLIEVDDMLTGLNLVRKGKLFGYIDAVSTLAYKMQEEKIIDIKIAGKFDLNYELAIATRNDEKILNSIMQKALDSITKDEKKIIQNKWYSIKVEEIADYSLLFKVLAVAGILIIVSLIWNFSLRKKVQEGVRKYKEQELLLIQQAREAEMGGMLGAITHQLKQPINVIGLATQNITLKFETDSKELKNELNETTNDIMSHVKFMNSTINEFKNFFKKDNDSFFSPIECAKKVKELFKGILEEDNIQIVIHEKNQGAYFDIFGSKVEFMQIFLNMFNNTKDALVEQERVDGKIDCFFEKNENYGVITIQDNAGGIPKELLPNKIFDSYVSTKDDNGTGIGLYIVRSIIEKKLNGTISVQNIDGGSQFVIELPLTYKV